MSEKKLDHQISTEEKIKKLEAKADKIEILLVINILFSLVGCFLFITLIEILGFSYIIFIVFFAFYGIMNLIILMRNNKDSQSSVI